MCKTHGDWFERDDAAIVACVECSAQRAEYNMNTAIELEIAESAADIAARQITDNA